MVEQDDRTHSGRRATKLSAAKIPPMDREDQWAFAKWVPRFREKIRTDERMAAWDALAKKRCLPGDLEWAFYWAIDSMETASYVPAKLRAFAKASGEVRRKIRDLWPSLGVMMRLKILRYPVWSLFFGLLQLEKEEAVRFTKFLRELAQFEACLKLFPGKKTAASTLAQAQAECEAHGQVILQLFLKVFTGSVCHKETAVLLEAAGEAYNLDVSPSFSEAAVAQRYKRFIRSHGDEAKEIKRDLRMLRAERVKENQPLELIPFLIAREKGRARELMDLIDRRPL